MARSGIPADDPRGALVPGPPARGTSRGVSDTAPRPPHVFELTGETVDLTSDAGSRSWYVRGQNFCIGVTELAAGDELAEEDVPDEYLVLVPGDGAVVTVTGEHEDAASMTGAGLAIVAPGTSVVRADRTCTLVRIFSAHAAQVMARAANQAPYETADPAVGPLPPPPARETGHGTRLLPLVDLADEPGRFGRILRSTSLMVNWFAPQDGPRSVDALSPHVHDDFEQASLTLAGNYVHHFRTPWTPRLREWRPDVQAACASPSIAVIPPGVIHTTRAVEAGHHQLIDVFAPPRADFAAQGWVVNADDYEDLRRPERTHGAGSA